MLLLLCSRATLLLVPLLGLNFLLTPFRPEQNHPWEHAYEVVSAVTASLQVRALLFSFAKLITEPRTPSVLTCTNSNWQIERARALSGTSPLLT